MRDRIAQVNEIMRREGINQDDLAGLILVSQGHLSKILSGRIKSGKRVNVALDEFIRVRGGVKLPPDEFGRKVADVAAKSPEFARLVQAAMDLMQNMHSGD